MLLVAILGDMSAARLTGPTTASKLITITNKLVITTYEADNAGTEYNAISLLPIHIAPKLPATTPTEHISAFSTRK